MKDYLRIAVFAHEFPALSETFVLNQITGLIDRGHDVTIFAYRPRPESHIHADVAQYGLAKVTRYRNVAANKFAQALAAGALLVRNVGKLGPVLLRCLDARRYGQNVSVRNLFFWAVRTVNEKPFDAIYCHFGPVGQLAVMLRDVGALSGPVATAFHGVDVSAYVRNKPDVYRFLFSAGDLFLPVSARWRRRLVDLGCPPGKIEIHHMGVALEAIPFRVRSTDGVGTPLRVLSVGRMVEKKGLAFGLQAVAQVVRRGIPVQYTLIGDGPLRHHLEQLADALGISSSVDFRGWQDRNAVTVAMEANDILLAPSVATADGDEEGIPVTIMEAMAAGAIVVATRHSGIPELVEDGTSGILTSEGSIDELASALTGLAESRDDWAAIRCNARARINENFDVAKLNVVLEKRLRTMADAWRPHGPVRGRTSSTLGEGKAYGGDGYENRLVRNI